MPEAEANSSTSSPAATAAAPAVPDNVYNAINAFNSSVESGSEAIDETPAQEVPEASPEAPPADAPAPVEPEAEPAIEEKPAEGEQPKEDKPADAAPAPDTATATKLTAAETPFEEFTEAAKAYLDTVEVTPELQAIYDRQNAEIANARQVLSRIDSIANADTLVELGTAMNSIYSEFQTDPDTGAPIYNTDPLLKFFQKEMPKEFDSIAQDFLAVPSSKYDGHTLFEQILVDYFGADKANKMIAYGNSSDTLPERTNVPVPTGIEDPIKEAYFRLPAVKQNQIQSLVDGVIELQNELSSADTTEWRKEEVARELNEKRQLLDAEVQSVKSQQQAINYERQQQTVLQQQAEQRKAQFRSSVNNQYNADIFQMADTFAKDLAPRLDFVAADAQLDIADNILATIQNALGFAVQPDGTFVQDPMAEFYAKRLQERGVDFNFAQGRNLLQRYYHANERLLGLTASNASPRSINIAENEKKQILFDIKTQQRSLLGQLTTKYVQSNAKALQNKVDAVQAKKQAVRPRVPSKAASMNTAAPVEDAIKAFNRDIADREKNGDELYNYHSS